MSTAALLMAMFGALKILGGYIYGGIHNIMVYFMNGSVSTRGNFGVAELAKIIGDILIQFLLLMLPLFAVSLLVGIVANLVQVGFLFSGKTIRPKFSKINPLQGFKRIFSMRSVVEMIKAILKVVAIGTIAYLEFMKQFGKFSTLMMYDIQSSAAAIVDMCINIAFQCGIALVFIGVIDYVYQWWEYEKNLRMTKQEIKDEYKMMEGDPKIKGKIKEKQRQMAMSRMMASVPSADVVITNPTHYAVALRYDEKEAPAPVMLAKGKDLIAQRIKKVAIENHVEIVENKAVAQALFISMEIGQMIPEDMYAAVADILAYVYKLKNPNINRDTNIRRDPKLGSE